MCTVAISNSPVFSPSSRASPSSCSSSPASPFKFRLQRPPTPVSGLIRTSNEDVTVLKRKRPTKLAIPIGSLTFCVDRSTPAPVPEDRWQEVEVDEDGYSIYCKRGKKEHMEDRFKAKVDFNGDNKQVRQCRQ